MKIKLWKISKVLAWAAVIFAVFFAINHRNNLDYLLSGYNYNPYFERLSDSSYIINISEIKPPAPVKAGDYKLSVPRMQVITYRNEQGDLTSGMALFVLKASNLNPWLRSPMFYRSLYATDNIGNTYQARDYGYVSEKEVIGNLAHTGLFSTYYEMWVSDLDLSASELTLRFDRYGQDVAIVIPLEERQ